MAKRIFVTATNTNIGKTYTTCRLIEAFSRLGHKVGVYKPIETGVEDFPLDGQKLFQTARQYNREMERLELDDIVTLTLPLPAAPFVANEAKTIDFSRFDHALKKIEALCDIVIIEGAGGIMVPIDEKHMIIDLASHFKAVTLLVSHCRLGCINDTLLNLEKLESLKIPFLWALNCHSDDTAFETVSLPYFQYRFEKFYRVDSDIDTIARVLLDTISSVKEERQCDI